MFYAYVIENSKGKHYTGSTECLKGRIKIHNDESPEKAKFHRSTYKKGPWHVLFNKQFTVRKEAIEFEKFLKTGKGRKWLERARLGG